MPDHLWNPEMTEPTVGMLFVSRTREFQRKLVNIGTKDHIVPEQYRKNVVEGTWVTWLDEVGQFGFDLLSEFLRFNKIAPVEKPLKPDSAKQRIFR